MSLAQICAQDTLKTRTNLDVTSINKMGDAASDFLPSTVSSSGEVCFFFPPIGFRSRANAWDGNEARLV